MTTKTRVKKPAKTVKTREEIEVVMRDYAAADAERKKINATIDLQITAIRAKHEAKLLDLDAHCEEKVEDLELFANSNKALFEKQKSIEFPHGTIGFRTGTHKIKQLRKLTWDSITELLRKKLPKYVRTKYEPAKDKLIADRELKAVSKHFEHCGIEVVQEETFFVDLKKEGE